MTKLAMSMQSFKSIDNFEISQNKEREGVVETQHLRPRVNVSIL